MAAKEQDEKSKRLRELLSSFYGFDSLVSQSGPGRRETLQGINLANFDADHYISSLLRKTPLDRLLQRHVEMAAEIKNVDSDMQMLVYENYNKFISATDTIRRMKGNASGMESSMDQLLKTVAHKPPSIYFYKLIERLLAVRKLVIGLMPEPVQRSSKF